MRTGNNSSELFSIVEGGLLDRALATQKLTDTQNKFALFSVVVAWLPLLIICAIDGTLFSGVQMPFLFDVAMQSRLLIALPLLIFIKTSINGKMMHVSKHIIDELVFPEARELIIGKAFLRAKKLIRSPITEIIMILIVVASTVSLVNEGVYTGLESGKTTWMIPTLGNGNLLSMAGYYSIFISIPVTQFLLLRWLWRYIVWVGLLLRFSKSNLNLLPTHADKSGGLGIIVLAQRSFGLMFFAIGVILSGQLTAMLIDDPGVFNTIKTVAFGFIVIALIFLIFPLLFFAKKLYKTKCDGLLKLGYLSNGLSKKFEHEWINTDPVDKILVKQEIDPSLIYDYAGMYGMLEELRIVPVTIHDVLSICAMLFLPFIPIVFIHFSIGELMQKIAGMVI